MPYQQDLSAEALEAYRLADQAYLRARSEAPEYPHRVSLYGSGTFCGSDGTYLLHC